MSCNGRKVSLTRLEFDLLLMLASHEGQIFSKEELFRGKRIHSVAYEDVYKLSFMSPPNSWFVNSFPPNGEEMFMMGSGTFGARCV